jgi:DNA helicase IV
MNLFDLLLTKKENPLEPTDQNPLGALDSSLILKLEQHIEKLQQEISQIKLHNQILEEENMELAKRPTLADYEYKNNLIQQLAIRLKKIDQGSVSKKAYEQLKKENLDLKQEVQTVTNDIEQVKCKVREYEDQNNTLQWQLEQTEAQKAIENSIEYDVLRRKYDALHASHNDIKRGFEQQVKENESLNLQLMQLHEQMEHMKQTLLLQEQKVVEYDSFPTEEDKEVDSDVEEIRFSQGTPHTEIVMKEELELPIFDHSDAEDVSEEMELLVEREIDEAEVEQAISEVLSKTVPKIGEDASSPFSNYDLSSFLPRADESERDYLKRVINKLNSFIKNIPQVNFDSTYEMDYSTAYVEGIIRKRTYESNHRFEQMKDRPYIGRVDYVTESGPKTMYLGEQGVDDSVTSWKAEAASLYYMRTVGQPIAHETLGDTIVDYIRQIDIQKGKITALHPPMTATSQYLNDEGLVSALANKRGLDMQSIVATLQREQYDLIRLPMNQPVVIQGSAGSGKSAIALHRLSYLLYRYQNLKPDRVAILGPNEAFLKHIQNVLPTLGDFGVKQTTFLELASSILMVSPSKVKRHKALEMAIIKTKGSLEFMDIVQSTTINMMNDLRIWAKAFSIKSLSIPVLPILRNMEKYQQLTLKDRENLYFNFFLNSFQHELQAENKVQAQTMQWIKEKAKSIEQNDLINLTLYGNDFITSEISTLREQWAENAIIHKYKRSSASKKNADKSRQQLISAIQKEIQLKMEHHSLQLKQMSPDTIEDRVIDQAWNHHVRNEVRIAKEGIILEQLAEEPVEVVSVETILEIPIFQQRLKEEQERVLHRLAMEKEAFFSARKALLHEMLQAESLMRLERAYYKEISLALKNQYGLEYKFSNEYGGYAFEEKLELSDADRDIIKKYVKKHLEFDYFDSYDEALRVAKSQGLLPDEYQSQDLYYEDLPALLHIARILQGLSKEHKLSYLIIDEAQDYMPYEIVELNALTQKNGLMLIGDLGQNLNPASSLEDWHSLDDLIGKPFYHELSATYRSTSQIVEVSNTIIEPFAAGKYKLSTETFREGAEVKWIETTGEVEEKILIAVLEEAIYTHNFESVAVVVKDESMLESYHYMIDPYFTVAIQTTAELPSNAKVIITTPTAVKGLEFEAVVIVSFQDYSFSDFDRKLAYVATSRALHQLYITFDKSMDCLITP